MDEQITLQIKQLFFHSKYNPDKLSEIIDEYLIPQEIDVKQNAEISTPYKLREEMLDSLDLLNFNFWSGKYIKYKNKPSLTFVLPTIFEPCCGKGGFLISLINRLMKELKEEIPDDEERYRRIVEESIYFADINPLNIYICKLLLNRGNKEKYKLNYYIGDTLKLQIQQEFKIEGFDLVVGNPPYNAKSGTNTGNSIWQKFVVKSLSEWVDENGYLIFVHPNGWRKPCYKKSQLKELFQLLTNTNSMLYLEIHNSNDGKATFKCNTTYDWYLVCKNKSKIETKIKTEIGEIEFVQLSNKLWLPNYHIMKYQNMFSHDINELNDLVIMDSKYHATQKHVCDNMTDVYKYPLIHSTPKKGITYKYSNCNDKGHFGISKIIFGESGINHVIVDMDGKYGMTQGAIAIKINSQKQGDKLKKWLLSEFKDVLKTCSYGGFRIDASIFRHLKPIYLT